MLQGAYNAIRSWTQPTPDKTSKPENTAEVKGSKIRAIDNNSSLATVGKAAKWLTWDAPVSMLSRAVSTVAAPVSWLTENHFGASKLVGKLLVPSQLDHLCSSSDATNMVNQLCGKNDSGEPFKAADGTTFELVPFTYKNTELNAVICYPPNWDKTKEGNNRCVVFNNPNGMLMTQFIYLDGAKVGQLKTTMLPGHLQKDRKCPVIFYDYKGTGINKTPGAPWPTNKTIVKDGTTVLKFALSHYQNVEVAGTSLGGGVATASLENVISNDIDFDSSRVKLISHDSFSTTPRVILPSMPKIADTIGWLLGGFVNAERSMKKLLDRKIPVTVMHNLDDKVIGAGARMVDVVRSHASDEGVLIVENPLKFSNVHAMFTDKMAKALTTPESIETLKKPGSRTSPSKGWFGY